MQSFSWWVPYALGATGVIAVTFGMLVSPPDAYDIIFLGIIALAWTVMAAFW
jgi:hypothetical protein